MKIFLISIFIFVLFTGICFALSIEDDGYTWDASGYEERIEVCKTLARTLGKDYMWWFGAFNAFYDNTNESILKIKIKEVAVLLPSFEEK